MEGKDKGEIILYQSEDGNVHLDVRLENETVWLTQEQLCLLFNKAKSTISEHISNIFKEGELEKSVVVRKFRTTTPHGAIAGKMQNQEVLLYNLDVIISVGYRVHSIAGTRFRQWATKRLREYIVKGWTLDVNRLKGNGGGQYWYDLLNTIKDIRSSEKVLYRQVLDLYATSIDYDASDEETRLFFKIVQNKFHFATHGQTAAELIYNRADSDKEFMGLTSFKGSHPTLADVTVAKNYLSETELRYLNNLVSGYFDFAENQALMRKPMTMHDYRVLLDNILSANGAKVLDGSGSVSNQQAREKAIAEYRKYQVRELTPVEKAYLDSLQKETKSLKKN
ncbi:MAG: virulence RhuM family protein [Bacteroidales bacterium]|nr:virulence RhuM family protein [Bacteroidales bacterium]